MIKAHTIISRSNDQVSCDLAGEKAILNIQAGMYYGLEGVGGFVWEILKKPTTYLEIKTKVLSEYEISDEICDNDLQKLLSDLKKEGLVRIHG